MTEFQQQKNGRISAAEKWQIFSRRKMAEFQRHKNGRNLAVMASRISRQKIRGRIYPNIQTQFISPQDWQNFGYLSQLTIEKLSKFLIYSPFKSRHYTPELTPKIPNQFRIHLDMVSP